MTHISRVHEPSKSRRATMLTQATIKLLGKAPTDPELPSFARDALNEALTDCKSEDETKEPLVTYGYGQENTNLKALQAAYTVIFPLAQPKATEDATALPETDKAAAASLKEVTGLAASLKSSMVEVEKTLKALQVTNVSRATPPHRPPPVVGVFSMDPNGTCTSEAIGSIRGFSRGDAPEILGQDPEARTQEAVHAILENIVSINNELKQFTTGTSTDEGTKIWMDVLALPQADVIRDLLSDKGLAGYTAFGLGVHDLPTKVVIIDADDIYDKQLTGDDAKQQCHETGLSGLPFEHKKTRTAFAILFRGHYYVGYTSNRGFSTTLFNNGQEADEARDFLLEFLQAHRPAHTPLDTTDKETVMAHIGSVMKDKGKPCFPITSPPRRTRPAGRSGGHSRSSGDGGTRTVSWADVANRRPAKHGNGQPDGTAEDSSLSSGSEDPGKKKPKKRRRKKKKKKKKKSTAFFSDSDSSSESSSSSAASDAPTWREKKQTVSRSWERPRGKANKRSRPPKGTHSSPNAGRSPKKKPKTANKKEQLYDTLAVISSKKASGGKWVAHLRDADEKTGKLVSFVRKEETRKGRTRYILMATKKNQKALQKRIDHLRREFHFQVTVSPETQSSSPETTNSYQWLSEGSN